MSYRDEERPLSEHIRELAIRLRRIVISILLIFTFTFMFKVNLYRVDPINLYVPLPTPSIENSISVQITRWVIRTIVPHGVIIITISAFDPLMASLLVALLIAVALSMPIILWEFWGFVSPALYPHERRMVKVSILPSMTLFLLGALFAFFIIIPALFKFYLLYVKAMGVEPTISLSSLIQTVAVIVVSMGIAFQTPLIMVLLTRFGIVKASTWRRYWRWGVLTAFVFALIISPGATGGLIETIIGVSISALYIVGMVVSEIVERRSRRA